VKIQIPLADYPLIDTDDEDIIQVYVNDEGLLHKEDEAALVFYDGGEYWCLNGVMHREGGPAVTDLDGVQEWYQNGKLHREDGPAIIHPNGDEEWYLNGVFQHA
jgi:hypothetical protein